MASKSICYSENNVMSSNLSCMKTKNAFGVIDGDVINIGDGFGNQSYVMVYLLILANLLVQFRHKKNNASSFSQCIYN